MSEFLSIKTSHVYMLFVHENFIFAHHNDPTYFLAYTNCYKKKIIKLHYHADVNNTKKYIHIFFFFLAQACSIDKIININYNILRTRDYVTEGKHVRGKVYYYFSILSLLSRKTSLSNRHSSFAVLMAF